MNTLRIVTSSDLSRSLIGALACIGVGSMACARADLDERDLGSTFAQSSADPPEADRTPLVGPDGDVYPVIEGRWIGHAEDLFAPAGPDGERPIYTFPSGSTEFALDLWFDRGIRHGSQFFDQNWVPFGQLVFGAGTVPEPLPGVVYPPGFVRPAGPSNASDVQLAPLEGLAYSLEESVLRVSQGVGVAEGTLALGYNASAAYEAWCSLQTPRPLGDGRFDCLALSENTDPNAPLCSAGEERYECALADLCDARNICSCTETECHGSGELIDLWLIRDRSDLLGTLVGAVFDYGIPGRYMPVGTIRFQRVSP
jgi:hypothetical protein